MEKFVDGVIVECSPEEAAAIQAEWDANDPAKLPVPVAEPTIADIIAVLPQESKDALAENMQLKSSGVISLSKG